VAISRPGTCWSAERRTPNTPGVIDPTNPVSSTDYRVVAEVDRLGQFRFTKTNAYSGNNGRAAILNDSGGGVNTVYFVDTTGHACPSGVGVPQPGAKLPTGLNLGDPYPVPGYPAGTTRPRDCPGRPPRTVCAMSPDGSTGTAR
jgi:hypothetical protein